MLPHRLLDLASALDLYIVMLYSSHDPFDVDSLVERVFCPPKFFRTAPVSHPLPTTA